MWYVLPVCVYIVTQGTAAVELLEELQRDNALLKTKVDSEMALAQLMTTQREQIKSELVV